MACPSVSPSCRLPGRKSTGVGRANGPRGMQCLPLRFVVQFVLRVGRADKQQTSDLASAGNDCASGSISSN